jgi:hypothetical protein
MRWKHEARTRLPALLDVWLRVPITQAPAHPSPPAGQPDLTLHAGERTLLVAVRGTDDIATLDRAARQLASIDIQQRDVKIVVVPFMGPKARAWARQRGISWADLSGNADIRGLDLCIIAQGERNLYASPGRPSNPFTPRYSRVGRALLVDPDRWWKQTEIAASVELPSGTVSKAVQRLDALDLLDRNEHGEIRARAPSLLLDSWAQRYQFGDHALRRYHVVARSGAEALRTLAEKLTDQGTNWAATGLSAAWLYTAFADFRLNTFFVDQHPRDLEVLGLRQVDRGENVWLVVPRDDGVLYRTVERGPSCAHPVQVYLDLLGHPERADDAARDLRERWMAWRER